MNRPKVVFPDNIKATLEAKGFQLAHDSVLPAWAIKEYDTAVGKKICRAIIFPATPNRVDLGYDSEGRNILQAYSFTIDSDPIEALEFAEKLINGSYARRLYLNKQK